MLVQFFDADGRETWVNPIHVRVVRTRQGMLGGAKGAEIWFSYSSMSDSVKVAMEPSEVAELLNAAMPVVYFGEGSDEDEGSTGKTHTEAD